jgi:hypothetical protein
MMDGWILRLEETLTNACISLSLVDVDRDPKEQEQKASERA